MAIAILFCLLFAAGITLLLVPVLYGLFFQVDFAGVLEEGTTLLTSSVVPVLYALQF